MLKSAYATNGMVVAPHRLAAEAGLAVLREGGNAIEAMVAAASTVAVVYPHMNSIGGDGFWLISKAGAPPLAIDACGAAAAKATKDFYRERGHAAIPGRGPHAALTAAGAISGWQAALGVAAEWGGTMPLDRLLADAIRYAKDGCAVTQGQVANTEGKLAECRDVPGFAAKFLPGGKVPAVGDRFVQADLAATFERLAAAGLDDFYRGDIAASIAADLAAIDSPVAAGDLAEHAAQIVEPLALKIGAGTLYNMTPPTQGLVSLLILGVYDRLRADAADGFDFVHRLVEATKQAFEMRDAHITDPAYMTVEPRALLADDKVAAMADRVDRKAASPWPRQSEKGDTVWLGAIDDAGNAVSFIQSVYWEFGSGVVLPRTGIAWQNRGASFSLDPKALNTLLPGRKPFHTLNPAMARLNDGRLMPYGTMGGEGQPQTQAAVFARHVLHGQSVQEAITAPRWLLGRTWGSASTSLKIEANIGDEVIAALTQAGHEIEVVAPYNDTMGHAGALVRRPDGIIEGGSDPRSDGAACGF
jgi:gamma-glutamyltranspeptidase/glutathione hydrolase